MKDKQFRYELQQSNMVKSSGVKIARKHIINDNARFRKENESQLHEAFVENKVLKMKRFYKRRRWDWPPKTHHIATVVHMINGYYGKELVEHTPKDELEQKMKL